MSYPAPNIQVLTAPEWGAVNGSPPLYLDQWGNQNYSLREADYLETPPTLLYDQLVNETYCVAINLKDLDLAGGAGTKIPIVSNDLTKGGLQFKKISATEYEAKFYNDGGGSISSNWTRIVIPAAAFDASEGRLVLTGSSTSGNFKAYLNGVEIPGTTVSSNNFGFVGLGQGTNHLLIGQSFEGNALRLKEWIGVELNAAQVLEEFQDEEYAKIPLPIESSGVSFSQDGSVIDYVPEVDVPAGSVLVLGDLVAVTKRSIKAGELGTLSLAGIFSFPKETGPGNGIDLGSSLYWDDVNHVVITTATTEKYLGKAVSNATEDDTTVQVRMNQ